MPARKNTCLEMRIIKASKKMMSPLYDEDPEALYCLVNIMAPTDTPGFEDYSAGIVREWIQKYNAK